MLLGLRDPGCVVHLGLAGPARQDDHRARAGQEFSFRVKAVDAAGNESALSSAVTGATAPDVTPPTTPGNLRVTATTPSSVSLAWDRSTDSWGFGYQVLVDGEVVGSPAS